MGGSKRGRLPEDLVRGRSRFRAWRRGRKVGSRIPEPLWALAVGLVTAHGVGRVSSVLGLDYYSLKQRAEAGMPKRHKATGRRPASGPFVELRSPLVVGKQCLFQWDQGGGPSLHVQLVGYDAAEVAVVARSFCQAE